MYTGPNIIKDGLVFGYDTGYGIADNTTATRFYPGGPTTNVVTNRLPTTGWSTANAQGSSITRTFLTENGIPFMRFSNVTNGSDYPRVTDSVFYNSTTVTGAFSTSLEVRGTAGASLRFRIYQNGSTKITNTVTLTSDWVRYTFDNQTTSFNLNQPYFNPVTTGATYDIRNIQIESKSYTTPFVDGTRSSTASLIDLKETTDINVSNVSFDSTGQPTFDGTDDRVDMGDTSLTDFGTGNFTIEAVLYIPSDITTNTGHYKGVVVKKGANGANAGMGIYYNTGHQKFLWSTANGSSSVERFTNNTFGSLLGTYIHVVMVRDSSATNNGHFYINGVHEAISSGGSLMDVNNNYNLLVGASSTLYGSYFLEGSVPVAKIYNTALTATEIKQNYNAYKNRFDI